MRSLSGSRPGAARAGVTLMIGLIRAYQTVSRLTPAQCRFHPSCSQYAAEALERHGAVRGLGLTAGRLCRCHPWHPGGLDPVPVEARRV